MKRILFEGSSSDEFIAELCSKFSELISELKQENKPDNDELLTRVEAAQMLKITLPTLNNWSKEGVVTSKYLGRRVYYMKQDIINALNR